MLDLKNLQVRSKNSVDNKELIANIAYNLENIPSFIEKVDKHDRKALLISAGRSIDRHMEEIKKRYEEGSHDIFCVKHSYKKLIQNGVVPTGCFILDPRPFEGVSTHGEQRKALFDQIYPETVFYVASMCNTQYIDFFKEREANVVGWHPVVSGIEKFSDRTSNLIHIGTSSAIRGIGALEVMGYKHIELIGYDSDVPEPTEQQKRITTVEGPPKYSPIRGSDGKTIYWSTGELLAQVQDLKIACNAYFGKVFLVMWPGGLGVDQFNTETAKLLNMNRGSLKPRGVVKVEIIEYDNPEKTQLIEVYHPQTIQWVVDALNKPL